MAAAKTNIDKIPSYLTQQGITLQAVLDSVLDGIITIEADGSIATVNFATESLFGYEAKEIIGKNIRTLMPDNYAKQHDQFLKNYLKSNHAKIIGTGREVVGLRKDGSTFPIELAVNNIKLENKRMFVGIIRDITIKRLTEETLKLHHEMLDKISAIQSEFILEANPRIAFQELLNTVIACTDSEYGFIGEIRPRSENPTDLKTHATNNILWSDTSQEFFKHNDNQDIELDEFNKLYKLSIEKQKTLITNNPRDYLNNDNNTNEHLMLKSFAAISFNIGERMVGIIALANRSQGYDENIIKTITPLTDACANIVGALESVREKKKAEKELKQVNEQLNDNIEEMRIRNHEITLLGELDEMLQSCYTRDEAYNVIAHMANRLFPNSPGSLYVRQDNDINLNLVKQWGEAHFETVFPGSDCIALRRGRVHLSDGQSTPLNCLHINSSNKSALCIPLVAQSESFGLLEIDQPKQAPHFSQNNQDLAVAISRRVAISLANLKLGESLREQSTKDPLTGLYNRRYFEEVFNREISRAKRSNNPLSVILFDIDNFKQVNDTLGHDIGDEVLIQVAETLQIHTRECDIACRLGGEEFMIILGDCPNENAVAKADEIRTTWATMSHGTLSNLPLDVTISGGVSTFPQHGEDRDNLVKMADKALYLAKNSGRNRIISL